MLKNLLFVLLLCVFLAGCIDIPFGDGSGIKLSKDGVSLTDEEGQEHTVNVDEESGQVSVTSIGSEGEEVEMEWGEDLELPASFPADIPLPDDIRIFQASDIDGSVTVGYEVAADFTDIQQLYQSFMESASMTEQTTMEGQGENNHYIQLQGQREDGSISVSISHVQQEEGLTQVLLIYMKKTDES